MTRASAAKAELCLNDSVRERRRGVGGGGVARLAYRVSSRFVLSAGAIGVILAALATAAMTLQNLRVERELALLDMRATILAGRIDAALAAAPQASPSQLFRLVLDAYPGKRLAEAVLVDRFGRALAADPAGAAAPARLARSSGDRFKSSEAIRVEPDGKGEYFATFKSLPAMAGTVAFASPSDSHLAAWRRAARVTTVLLAATVGLIVAGGVLYGSELRRKQTRIREDRSRRAHDLPSEAVRSGTHYDEFAARVGFAGALAGEEPDVAPGQPPRTYEPR
ncbi:MAG: hypothetical protein JO288_22955, partial [Hyphomicrobiales bacterium]|nr:hypothetical protein [Hyphomicrobiales bacterium]